MKKFVRISARIALFPVAAALCGAGLIHAFLELPQPRDAARTTAPASGAPGAKAMPSTQTSAGSRASGAAGSEPTQPFAVDGTIAQVLRRFQLDAEAWEELRVLSSAELEIESETTRERFSELQRDTTELWKRHTELGRTGNDHAANELIEEDVLGLLHERRALAGRLLLVAYARSLLAANDARDADESPEDDRPL